MASRENTSRFVLLGLPAAVAIPALGGSAGFGRRETHQAPGDRSRCQSWCGVRLSEPFRGLVSRPPQDSTGRSCPCACPSTASAGCIRLGTVREVGMESSGSTHFRSAPCGGLARSGVGDLVELDKFPSTRCRGLPCPAALLGEDRLVVPKKGAVPVGVGEAIFDQRSAKSWRLHWTVFRSARSLGLDRVLAEVPADKVARRQETATSARSARNKVEEPLDKVHGQVSLGGFSQLHAVTETCRP